DDCRQVGADGDLFLAVLAFADADRDVVLFVDGVHDVVDVAADGLGGDAVGFVISQLLFAAAVGVGQGAFHGAGGAVGVEDDFAVDVSCGAADGLDEGGFAAEEAFLVGVEDGDEAA